MMVKCKLITKFFFWKRVLLVVCYDEMNTTLSSSTE